jgi:DNA replication initiation complex subunit (GINS family)
MLEAVMGEFTYEDLYEILRAEKYSTDLQQIDKEQLRKTNAYFKSKEEFLVRQKEVAFDEAAEKTKIELENAKRALRDLYDKRERKVISRAVFCARSNFKLKDTTNMLLSEEKLYFALLEMLRQSGEEFYSFLNQDYLEEKPKTLKENFKRVKLVEAIPELMDTQLNRYGPFAATAEVELPSELAELLLKQGKAAEIISVEVKDENTKANP